MNQFKYSERKVIDLEEALSIAGIGWYNLKYCLIQAFFLISGIIEILGYSYVLPSAKCDLSMTDSQRGVIASIPYIAIVITSFFWGYLVDVIGRKRALIYSCLGAGGFGVVAAFMPEMISFTIFKLFASLCIACPVAAPYSLIGEILPQKHRDLALSVTNALQLLGCAVVPLVGWGILSLDFKIDFGLYYFRPWRVLAMVYSCFFLVAAAIIIPGPESPKFLVAQGRHDDALQTLQTIYAGNNNKSKDDYPVKRLVMPEDKARPNFIASLKEQSVPLLMPPYLKWLALNGFLLFGTFSVLNGLFMWVPDVLNRVLTGDSDGLTACQVILLRFNQTSTTEEVQCDDSIGEMTFIIASVSSVISAIIAVLLSLLLRILGKKILILLLFLIFGTFCILINVITENVIFAVLLSSLQLLTVALGPINAFAIAMFPTNLRGMAIGLSMMIGRIGSIFGTNVTGVLINGACEAAFYMFGGLLLFCGLLTLLLPKSNNGSSSSEADKEVATQPTKNYPELKTQSLRNDLIQTKL